MAALLDLGVPLEEIEAPLALIGLKGVYSLNAEEDSSYGIRGVKVSVKGLEVKPRFRGWREIKALLEESDLPGNLRMNALSVFYTLAEVEASVHGKTIEQIHFHEVGAIDALVDIVGVCAAIEGATRIVLEVRCTEQRGVGRVVCGR